MAFVFMWLSCIFHHRENNTVNNSVIFIVFWIGPFKKKNMYQLAVFAVVLILRMEDNIIASFISTGNKCPEFLHHVCSQMSNFADVRALF